MMFDDVNVGGDGVGGVIRCVSVCVYLFACLPVLLSVGNA